MRSLGYEGYKLPREFPSHSVLDPVSFSSDDVLIASFLTRQPVATVPHRDQPNALLPVRLRGIFLDAATGNLLARRQWSTAYPGSVAIIGTRDGQFTVVNREHLALYSRSLKPLKELNVSISASPQSDLDLIELSPERRDLLLFYLRSEQEFNWINVDNLDVVRSWDGSRVPSSLSDEYLAMYADTYVKSRGFLDEVVLRNREGTSRTICRG